MRRSVPILAICFTIAACATTATTVNPGPSGGATGAGGARLAVESFLNAVRSEDIQAMGAVFGTSRGALRDTDPEPAASGPSQLEKRLIILQCFLAHDSFRVLTEVPGDGGGRVVRVELVRGGNKRQPNIYAVAGPGSRWYVENVELAAVRDFCGVPNSTQ